MRMINLRLYRIAFLPALLAIVVTMFSLEGAPAALEPAASTATFEGDRAAALARQIADTAPEREPGSPGDDAVADLVVERFEDVPAGVVAEQRFEADHDGEEVTLRNVLLTLPGDERQTIVIVAARDSAVGPGAATSAAATGILVELANALRVSHARTYILASISGSTAGAAGIRSLIENLPERDAIEAVLVVFQPGATERTSPFVVSSSEGEASPNAQLVRTAEAAVEVQAGERSKSEDAFTELARLAIPSGIGDQAPPIAAGADAVAISSAGERPLSGSSAEAVSGRTVDEFGRAVQATIDALDDAVEAPVHGPASYLELGDNLLPGWTLALLALTLILPALVAAVDACARAARAQTTIGAALIWAVARGLPFVGGLVVLYGLALAGVIPRPAFPFDPGLYELGGRAAVAFAAIAVAIGAGAWLLRSPLTARRAPEPPAPALGAIAGLACLGIWLANPYLGLLCAPAAHVWVLREGPPGPARRAAVVAAAVVCALPPLAAALAVAAALDLGADAPWTFTLMVADGQIGLLTTLAACFLAGALAGLVALALRRGPRDADAAPQPLAPA